MRGPPYRYKICTLWYLIYTFFSQLLLLLQLVLSFGLENAFFLCSYCIKIIAACEWQDPETQVVKTEKMNYIGSQRVGYK